MQTVASKLLKDKRSTQNKCTQIPENDLASLGHVVFLLRNTVMLVGSAPQYPHGIIDPIQGMKSLALISK